MIECCQSSITTSPSSGLLPEHKRQLYSLVMLLPSEVAASLQPEVQSLMAECRAAQIADMLVKLPRRLVRRMYLAQGFHSDGPRVWRDGCSCKAVLVGAPNTVRLCIVLSRRRSLGVHAVLKGWHSCSSG
jgi:hypothetical protein